MNFKKRNLLNTKVGLILEHILGLFSEFEVYNLIIKTQNNSKISFIGRTHLIVFCDSAGCLYFLPNRYLSCAIMHMNCSVHFFFPIVVVGTLIWSLEWVVTKQSLGRCDT